MWEVIVLLGKCCNILFVVKSYPGDFLDFSLQIKCLISFGIVCFAGRDIGKGLSRNLAILSGLTFESGVNIFERWVPKSSALSLSEIARSPFGPLSGVACSLILRIFLVVLHREPSLELSDWNFSWKSWICVL